MKGGRGLNFREELKKKNGIVLLGEDTQKERTIIHYICRTIIAISVKMAHSNNL